MKKGYLYKQMTSIDEKYILEAMDPGRFAKKHVSFAPKRFFIICACITLMLAAFIAIPLMIKNDEGIDIPPKYDFTSPEFADYELDGTTLVSYRGGKTDTLEIPEGIETIADYAFYGNSNSENIRTISLSSTVKKLESNALAGCLYLEKLIIGDNAEFIERDGLLMTANGETIIKYIGNENVKSYTIPDGVKYIAAHAFQAPYLEHITFPDGLLYIGYCAFGGVPLLEINLPNSVIEIADSAFGGCFWALDGSFPENMKYTETSFQHVPFYLSMLAGMPCPSEDIGKNNITITEAFKKSNKENITEQLSDVLEYYNTGVIPEETFCYASLLGATKKPEGAIIPDIYSLNFASLELIEESWDGNERVNIKIVIPCEGGYDLMLGYRLYDRWDCLYWKDVRWRIEEISFIPTNADQSADLVIGDWFIELEIEPANEYEPRDLYKGITFTHKDGRSIFESRFDSYMPYEFKISPDGNSFIVEYLTAYGWGFFIEDLTGKLYNTCWSYDAPCIPWFEKGDGKYLAHSAAWNTDPETMETFPICGTSEKGQFLMNYNTGTILRDDMYIYYDLLYLSEGLEDEWGGFQETRDGSDKYVTLCDRIYWMSDGKEGGAFLNEEYNATTYGIIYKTPYTWYMGMFDEYRPESKYADNLRMEHLGRLIKVSDDFEMKAENFFTATEVSSCEIFKGDGKYIKEYAVAESVMMLTSSARKCYFVEIRTTDNYIIPIYFYTYSDGDSTDYFDIVLRPIIESIRLCKTLPIDELLAEKTGDGQFLKVKFIDGNKALEGTLPIEGFADMDYFSKEDRLVYQPEKQYDFLGCCGYTILKFEEDYYLTFNGVFTGKFNYILKNGIFTKLD